MYIILRLIINIIDRLFLISIQKSQFRVELVAPKIAIFWNIVMFKNREIDSLWGWMLPKIRIISKNISNKSCWALNSIRESQWAHLSYLLQSRAWASKDCHLLKHYNVQKLGSRFTLWLDAAKNTQYIQKCIKWRKSHLQGLLMFSNVLQDPSVSPSAVNSFKVTNLCKNGIHICETWQGARFLGSNLAEFYFTLKFLDKSKIRTIVTKYFHSTPSNSKTEFLKIPGKSTDIF